MPTVAPITGQAFVSAGYTTQLYDATTSGTWSSADTTIATISSGGLVTGVANGDVTITYTVGSDTATLYMSVLPVQVTNGFNVSRIFPAMIGRIGLMQPTKSGSPNLSAANKLSTSGRYYTEGHELVTVNNIHDSQEDESITDDEFNAYLQTLDRAAIMRCLNGVFGTGDMPTFIEHRLCYLRRAYQQNVLIPKTANGAFCGYRINVAKGDYAVVFNAISLFFNGVATFNLYLFNDLNLAPVKTLSVTTAANSQTKVNLDWVINYITNTNNGGIYYIGYFDSDLPEGVQAIDEQLNLWEDSIVWSGTPFTSAKVAEQLNFNRRYVGTVFYSYGLNVEMSSYRDYTEVIVKNAHIFDDARILTYGITALGIIKSSLRSGGSQNVLDGKTDKMDLNMALNLAYPTDNFPFVAGLKQQLTRSLKNICNSFKQPNQPASYPCVGSNGNVGIYDTYQGMNLNNLPPRQTLT